MDSVLALTNKAYEGGGQHAAAKHYTSLDAFMVPPHDDGVNARFAAFCTPQIIGASNDTSVSGE